MCFFLTIAVPDAHAERIREAFGRGFRTSPAINRCVIEALPAGFAARVVTRGSCSCKLYARRDEQSRASAPQRPVEGLRPDVVTRLQTLCETAGSVAVLVHWYRGDVDTERFSAEGFTECGCADLSARAQALVEDHVLVATRF
jgi:hypothetical protein